MILVVVGAIHGTFLLRLLSASNAGRVPLTFWLVSDLGILRLVGFDRSNQCLKSVVDRLCTGIAHPLVPDDPRVIDDIVDRGARRVPLLRDGSLVCRRPPVQGFFRHDLLELHRVVSVQINANEREGLFFQLVHERPLVGPTGLSGQSVFRPEIEEHDLAAIVAEFESLTVLIVTFDLLGHGTHGQMADLV